MKEELMKEYEKTQRMCGLAVTVSVIALVVNALSLAIALAMRIMQ